MPVVDNKLAQSELEILINRLNQISATLNLKSAELINVINELAEINQKREREIRSLDETAKMLVKRDFELMQLREKQLSAIKELDEIAKRLVKRDFELQTIQEERYKLLVEVQLKNEELIKANKLLSEERARIAATISSLEDGILVFGLDNVVIQANPKVLFFLEVKEGEELIGKHISELAYIERFQKVLQVIGTEIKQVHREPVEIEEGFFLEITSVPVILEKKEIGKVVVFHDISREKRIERMKSEFVSIAAHQLRTPLATISWTLKMIIDGTLGSISEKQKEVLERSYQSAQSLLRLVNDLLNVTKIEEGKILTNMTEVSLANIAKSLLERYKTEITNKNLKIELKSDRDLPTVLVDRSKIELVIQNLIENAIKYTKENGYVRINISKKNNQVIFSVQDTGIGIPKEQQEKVFTKFFRASNASKITKEGTGLGLYVSKNIVEAHNGKMWFESEENKGSTFYFSLPLSQ